MSTDSGRPISVMVDYGLPFHTEIESLSKIHAVERMDATEAHLVRLESTAYDGRAEPGYRGLRRRRTPALVVAPPRWRLRSATGLLEVNYQSFGYGAKRRTLGGVVWFRDPMSDPSSISALVGGGPGR